MYQLYSLLIKILLIYNGYHILLTNESRCIFIIIYKYLFIITKKKKNTKYVYVKDSFPNSGKIIGISCGQNLECKILDPRKRILLRP